MKTDYLIVGQGLAGTILGYELLKAGRQCYFVDSPDYLKASEVAAGLINPVVFRRMTKSWMVDEFYPLMSETYRGMSEMLGEQFFIQMKMLKVFGAGEEDLWQRKIFENKLEGYTSLAGNRRTFPLLDVPYGFGWVVNGGKLNIKRLLFLFKSFLDKNRLISYENFEFDRLDVGRQKILYKDIEAGKIIFCEGHRGDQNPFFDKMKFKQAKGEILDLVIDNYRQDTVLNKSVFLMPVGEQRFRLGSTYSWDQLDERPTINGRNELTGKLGQFFQGNFSIEGHLAGIRPVLHDRRPVLGLHPDFQPVGIFNGLGAKGCIQAPYFAKMFVNFLLNKKKLILPEVNLSRYF